MKSAVQPEKPILVSVLLLLAYPAWVRGGTYVPIQGPLPWLGGLALLSLFASPLIYRGQQKASTVLAERVRCLVRDPVFYFGLAFLGLLLVQWWNAGRERIFDFAQWKWVYSVPRVTWLPSAVSAVEAREMLHWFFPAWAVVLVLRSGLLERRAFRALYIFIAVNAALLSVFGIVQYVSRTNAIYWMSPLPVHFFASFGYSNHAGAYFLLAFCVAAGLLLHELFGPHRLVRWSRVALFSVCALLSFAGANLSFGLVCMLLAWLSAGGLVLYVFWLAWQRWRPAQRINMIVAALAVMCLGYFLVASVARSSREIMQQELEGLGDPDPIEKFVDKRTFLAGAAVRIWQDHPWFGTGGWGFRYMLAQYVEPEQWDRIERGRANTHNDPLQFLAEFGAVGVGLMAAVCIALVVPVVRSGAWRRKVVHVPLVGVVAVLLYSLVDLPFRSPAILYVWLAILAAMPGFVISRQNVSHGDEAA